MPVEIEFSVLSDPFELYLSLMEQFKAETGIQVRLRCMNWEKAWNQLVRSAIYSEGPDVSEIGTTWTGDLVGMNALRPFTTTQLAGLGWGRAFVPVAWKNANPTGDLVWSIPWLSQARMIFYRRDIFENAGLDAQTAFSSLEVLDNTITALHEKGVERPWLVPAGGTVGTLHNIATWIWAAGGDYITADGKYLALDQPEAMQGMRRYFGMGRYITPRTALAGAIRPEDYFAHNNDGAMLVSGTWLVNKLPQLRSETSGVIGVVRLPGPGFVGGSNLVVWKYSRQAEAAYELVRFLTRTDIQMQIAPLAGMLPARTEALELPPFSSHPYWRLAAEALRSGRTFPTIRLWGIIEDRLAVDLNEVWNDMLAHPESSVDEILTARIGPLCQRLNLILQER